MYKTVLAAISAVMVVLTFSAMSIAQDKPDMTAKQDEMGKSGLMAVSCDTVCGFRVISHDQAEITGMVKQHAKAHHKMELTDADVKGMMKPAGRMGMRSRVGVEMKGEKKDEKDPHKH
ncbi:MAG TPA: DUF1059 domain-containing protein [Bacteroidota bacterium]|nr:DUF1059 domain-containing protein [Bacteroidota bacterium]